MGLDGSIESLPSQTSTVYRPIKMDFSLSLDQGRSEPSSPSETLVARFGSLSFFFPSSVTKMAPSLSERADLAFSSHCQVV